MTTPSDIIIAALKKAGVIGVGETPLAEDFNDAFDDLNDMVAQWQRERWLVWHLITASKVSTGALSYTVGPGGDFNIGRPDRLEAAFVRQVQQTGNNQVDYPLQIIEARETYNLISLKSLTAFPTYIFYDSAYPLGVIYPWPLAQNSIYEIFITVKPLLGQFTSLGETILFPSEYIPALKWNLAVRLMISYKLSLDPGLVALAKTSLNVIRGSNTQIPRLQMPADLIRRGIYNVYSDRIN